jgi:hypothetical protein
MKVGSMAIGAKAIHVRVFCARASRLGVGVAWVACPCGDGVRAGLGTRLAIEALDEVMQVRWPAP